jgi:hypothetical protein
MFNSFDWDFEEEEEQSDHETCAVFALSAMDKDGIICRVGVDIEDLRVSLALAHDGKGR